MVHDLAEAGLHAEQEHRPGPTQWEGDPARETGGRREQERDRRDLDRDGDARTGHSIEQLHEGTRPEQQLWLTGEVGEEGAGDPRRHHEAEPDPRRGQRRRGSKPGPTPSVERADHVAAALQVDTTVRLGSVSGPSSSRGSRGWSTLTSWRAAGSIPVADTARSQARQTVVRSDAGSSSKERATKPNPSICGTQSRHVDRHLLAVDRERDQAPTRTDRVPWRAEEPESGEGPRLDSEEAARQEGSEHHSYERPCPHLRLLGRIGGRSHRRCDPSARRPRGVARYDAADVPRRLRPEPVRDELLAARCGRQRGRGDRRFRLRAGGLARTPRASREAAGRGSC